MSSRASQRHGIRLLCALFLTVVAAFPSPAQRLRPHLDRSADEALHEEPRQFATSIELEPIAAAAKSGVAQQGTNTFEYFSRYPAETRTWTQLNAANEAYNRDFLFAGRTVHAFPADGDTFSCDGVGPNGEPVTFISVTYRASYNGATDCWVRSDGITLCGYQILGINWQAALQCGAPGVWTYNFSVNGNRFASRQFTMLPRVPPGFVPNYNQGAYTQQYANTPYTIQNLGCYLSALAMVVTYHLRSANPGQAVSVNPPTLNEWLKADRGYTRGGGINWTEVPRIIQNRTGLQIEFLGRPNVSALDGYICAYGPQVVGLGIPDPNGTEPHAATAVGMVDTGGAAYEFILNDPNGGLLDFRRDQLTYPRPAPPRINSMRAIRGPGYTISYGDSITVHLYSPAEVILTDPQGRRTGLDPRTGQSYQEIPNSFYGETSIGSPDGTVAPHNVKELEVLGPLEGSYTVTVIGSGEGAYDLDVASHERNRLPAEASALGIPVSPGSVHTYSFQHSPSAASTTLALSGGFDGGGQRPRDVNKFLSYGNITSSQTVLSAGATSFTLLVTYGGTVHPASLRAELNGVDISSAFAPVPGSTQAVTLNLVGGTNVLRLSIDGDLPNRIATDTDRLTFVVP